LPLWSGSVTALKMIKPTVMMVAPTSRNVRRPINMDTVKTHLVVVVELILKTHLGPMLHHVAWKPKLIHDIHKQDILYDGMNGLV